MQPETQPQLLPLDEHPSFDVRDVVIDAIESVAPHAREKQLRLDWCVQPSLPAQLLGDVAALRKLLTEIVANAVHCTEQGEVNVCAEIEHETARQVTVRFTVSDTSDGITLETLSRFFRRFSDAASDGLTDDPPGLADCRRLVDSIGASIRVDTGGSGSSFHLVVSLPKAVAPGAGPSTLH